LDGTGRKVQIVSTEASELRRGETALDATKTPTPSANSYLLTRTQDCSAALRTLDITAKYDVLQVCRLSRKRIKKGGPKRGLGGDVTNANLLTAVRVKNAKPGVHQDGQGLRLKVAKSGAKRWVLRVTIRERQRDVGVGPAVEVSLQDARERAGELRKAARDGRDPVAAQRAARSTIPTFREAAELVFWLVPMEVVRRHEREAYGRPETQACCSSSARGNQDGSRGRAESKRGCTSLRHSMIVRALERGVAS
jgi:hypothetical protein